MPRNFNPSFNLKPLAALKDVEVLMRLLLGLLLAANLVAAAFAFHLFDDSPEQIARQVQSVNQQAVAQLVQLNQTRLHESKVEKGREESTKFISTYMTNRRATYSTMISEIDQMANFAGMKRKESSMTLDAIQGSEALDMMTISANFEGDYKNLLIFINQLDKSKRFIIIESLAASPQQNGVLQVTMKLNTFVKEDADEGRAERKKVIALVGLMAAAGILYWMNSGSDVTPTLTTARPAVDPTATGAAATAAVSRGAGRRNASGHPKLDEFVPKLGGPVDPSKVDPTLHLDWLAKVQAIELDNGNHRNVFKIEAAPPESVAVAGNGKLPIPTVGPIHPNGVTPATPGPTPTPQPSAAPVAAGAPPINLKYYGYATKRTDGEKKAFFLDGDEVIVATEGEIIKKQYKVVRIGTNSVQMEDTASKSTQTLPLQEVAPA